MTKHIPASTIHSLPELLDVLPGNAEFCPEKAERRNVK